MDFIVIHQVMIRIGYPIAFKVPFHKRALNVVFHGYSRIARKAVVNTSINETDPLTS
jgi:hypothetical protein